MSEEKRITKVVVGKEDELTDVVTAILDSVNERVVLTFAEETDLLISPINLKVLLDTADEEEKLVIAQIIKNPTGIKNANLAGLASIDTSSFPTEDLWSEEESNRTKRLNPPVEKKGKVLPIQEEVLPVSKFQKRIDEAIDKVSSKDIKKDLPENDIFISLDEDIPIIREEEKAERVTEIKEEQNNVIETTITKEKFSFPVFWKKLKNKTNNFIDKIPITPKIKKLLPLILFSILLLITLVVAVYINTAVVVRIKIYTEAKEVAIEKVFKGDENIKEVDFENLKVPVKTKSVEKSRSTSVPATGTSFRGEKAKGTVSITYWGECTEDTPPVEISVNEGLLFAGDKRFVLDSKVSIPCESISVEANITAIEVGEEYNLPKGTYFDFEKFSRDTLRAKNELALKGGSKEEYTILSKGDIDQAVAELERIAKEEGESELKESSSTWEIIPDSIISKVVPDSIKSDVAIGAEAKEVSVSMKTSSTATYFLRDGFSKAVEKLLTEQAKEDNLFKTDKKLDLILGDDIEKEITIVDSSSKNVEIKLVARGAIKPKVDKEKIAEKLQGMKWNEGIKYLESLDFSEKNPVAEFLPEWISEKFWKFPKRRGRIIIKVQDVK